MEKKPSSTSPATVKLSSSEAIHALIKLTRLEIEPTLIGTLSPTQICNAGESLLMGLIKGLYDKLAKDEEFRNHFVCEFITGTNLYLLTDAEKLQEKVEDKKKEKLRIVLPFESKTH